MIHPARRCSLSCRRTKSCGPPTIRTWRAPGGIPANYRGADPGPVAGPEAKDSARQCPRAIRPGVGGLTLCPGRPRNGKTRRRSRWWLEIARMRGGSGSVGTWPVSTDRRAGCWCRRDRLPRVRVRRAALSAVGSRGVNVDHARPIVAGHTQSRSASLRRSRIQAGTGDAQAHAVKLACSRLAGARSTKR